MGNLNELFESKFSISGTRMPNGNYSSWTDQIKFDAFQEAWNISQAEVKELKDNIEMALISLNHLKENAVTHRDHGNEHTAIRDFNDLLKLASDIEDCLLLPTT